MTTVVRRTFRATPHRSSHDTWIAIVDLLTRGQDNDVRRELVAVAGTVASLIADKAALDDAMVVTCDGPRTRVYCTYDDDAVEGSDANEAPLGFDPLKGEWAVSLPCVAEDLTWVQAALVRRSTRISARLAGSGMAGDEADMSMKSGPLTLDPEGFLES